MSTKISGLTAYVSARVHQAGTIEIGGHSQVHKGFDHSGALVCYEPATADELHAIASKVDWVKRRRFDKNGHPFVWKKVRGEAYTLKMAVNDWQRLHKFK